MCTTEHPINNYNPLIAPRDVATLKKPKVVVKIRVFKPREFQPNPATPVSSAGSMYTNQNGVFQHLCQGCSDIFELDMAETMLIAIGLAI